MLDTAKPRVAFDDSAFADPAVSGTRAAAVTLLDTSVSGDNLGDQIIMDSVRRELDGMFDDRLMYTVNSHDWMGSQSRRVIRRSDFAIAGGTNMLSSRMWFRQTWKVSPRDLIIGAKIVLMGVGWYQYQGRPDPYSAWLIRSLLSRNHLHSVRESFAATMLASIGITNVINTGCPTLWGLTPDWCSRLPMHKAKAVLTTINSYKGLQSPEPDRRMLEMLQRHYETVYLWIQTNSDYEYAQGLVDGLKFVNPNLKSYDRLLDAPIDLDYVGNRLHAGVRALQRGRRAVIVEIDNRAAEMGRDFGLPTVKRDDFERLESLITQPQRIAVHPPIEAIRRWKDQFGSNGPQGGAKRT